MCKSFNTEKMEKPVPLILRPWIALFRSTPKIYIPGTRIDLIFALLFAVVFSILRLTFRHLLYGAGWPIASPDTYYVSASMVSVLHASFLLPGLGTMLWSQPYVPSGKLAPSPTWYKDGVGALMGFCTGYMVYDSILGYVVETWKPGVGPVLNSGDYLFLFHHIFCTIYMIAVQWMEAGHMSSIALMFNGEFSGPFMNVYFILEKSLQQECTKGLRWLPMAYAYSEQIFAAMYVICRVAISPIVIGHVSYDLLFTKRGRGALPVWLSVCLMPAIWGIQFGSIGWIMTSIESLKRGLQVGGGHAEL